jgi:hypothetical protein
MVISARQERRGVTVVRNGMTEQQEERLRGAVRGWLAAGDELAQADREGAETGVLMELAERATLARLVFQQTLVDLGWRPPAGGMRESG